MWLGFAVNYLYMSRHRGFLGKVFATNIAYNTTAFPGNTADIPAIPRRAITVRHIESANSKWLVFFSFYLERLSCNILILETILLEV